MLKIKIYRSYKVLQELSIFVASIHKQHHLSTRQQAIGHYGLVLMESKSILICFCFTCFVNTALEKCTPRFLKNALPCLVSKPVVLNQVPLVSLSEEFLIPVGNLFQ